MANSKITDLTNYTTPQSGDLLPIVDISGPTTKKVTLANFFNILSSLFRIKDSSDTTKQVAFNASGITTGTTRTITIPDSDFTPAGLTLTQTLTNKTISTGTKIDTSGSDTTGSLYYKDASGNLTALAIGTAGQIIDVSSGGLPEWIPNPSAADATFTVKGVKVLDANAVYYGADAGSTDAYAITLSPSLNAYAVGQVFTFKANTINTGAATLNVNGLGAKTIVKGVNTTLDDGDIAAGMFCTLIYDGTNFVLQNPVANPPVSFTNGVTSRAGQAAGGTQTIAHGLGKVPKNVRISTTWNSPANGFSPVATSNGVYNGTTQGCVYVYTISGVSGASSVAGNDSSHIILLRATNSGGIDAGQQAVCTVDATNITLTWSFYGTSSGMSTNNDINILWEAEG